ncbi:TPA: hypothetical protein N0F65_007461 [Lagenidium giganteum]|uniref:SCP domain-containing protein n=1 Tax=Lagenidium giganteum TaxID=4803 RepID=A0AAV2ZMQ5_9STRA|nr:TPA: hypothetical protein N0F65_007461 [Lagenidium giganteum]
MSRFVCLLAVVAFSSLSSSASGHTLRGLLPANEYAVQDTTNTPSTTATPAPAGSVTVVDYHAAGSFQEQLLDAVNKERANAGLPALCSNFKLDAAAQKHSEDMAAHNFMDHTGSDKSTMTTRVDGVQFQWSNLGENVAAGQQTVEDVMKSWMDSPGHKANILGNFKYFGCGMAKNPNSEYGIYWTQDFGSSDEERGLTQAASYVEFKNADTYESDDSDLKGLGQVPDEFATFDTIDINAFQDELLAAVNAERQKAGLKPLCPNDKLQKAAQLHSEDQASHNFMSHTGSDGSSMTDRINRQNFKWSNLGENVAAGQQDVKSVMEAWMNSSGHRANILGNFKFFGCGMAKNPNSQYKIYWTQDFGSGDSESCACLV